MSSESYHEPLDKLSAQTMDMHRAILSLMEELEAVDWYNQRVDASDDAGIQAILAHNRDEEKEHAAMVLEWIRRHDPAFDRQLRAYLFSDKPLDALAHEEPGEGGEEREGAGAPQPSPAAHRPRPAPQLTIGSLRGR